MTETSVTQWRKLSRWSILHFSASAIAQIVNNSFAVAAPLIALYTAGNLSYVLAGLLALPALILLYAVIAHHYFSYMVMDDRIQIRQGMLNKATLDLKFARIQNVDIIHPFYFRPLNLVSVKVESAGSSDKEVVLAALTAVDAEAMREHILRSKHTHDETSDSTEDSQSPILRRDFLDLVRHGVSSNRALIIVAALGTLYGQSANFAHDYIASLGFELPVFEGPTWYSALLVTALFALSAIASLLLLSVAGAIFTYFDYQLFATKEGFKARYGLLSRHEKNLKIRRIQAVVWRENWIDRALGRINLILEQASHQSVENQLNTTGNRLIVPSVLPEEAAQLSFRALFDSLQDMAKFDPTTLAFEPIHTRFRTKYSAIWLIAIIAIMAIPATQLGGAVYPIAAVLLSILAVLCVHRRWQRWGFAVIDDMVVVRSGFIGNRYVISSVQKLQQVQRHETPLMRRRNLQSLSLVRASGTTHVPYLPTSTTSQFTNFALFELESKRLSWM